MSLFKDLQERNELEDNLLEDEDQIAVKDALKLVAKRRNQIAAKDVKLLRAWASAAGEEAAISQAENILEEAARDRNALEDLNSNFEDDTGEKLHEANSQDIAKWSIIAGKLTAFGFLNERNIDVFVDEDEILIWIRKGIDKTKP